ncbi:XrtA system polysaccharide chain length determinant [Desulfonatronum thioautotrophicum]|uniref:XrtA system polysaccharide chain length determinant n=1 Tax=Desulfonatronum thioautotrophicum TaxID=617001 RepID=UPI0005EBB1B8|nr:XrtA system polysaccharide chain length determinant [Desulfonatronum thioautotrophicum]
MTAQPELDVKKYLRLAYSRRFLILFVAIAISFLAIFYSLTQTNKYQASSTVFIEESVIASLMRGVAVTPSMDAKIRVLTTAMQSRTMLLQVLRELNMDLAVIGNDAALESLIASTRNSISIRLRARDGLFVVSFTHSDPRIARDFVNTLVRRYIEENISAGRDDTYAAFGFLAEQIDLHRQRLDAADAAVMDLRVRKGDLLNRDPGQLLEQISMAEDRLQELSLRRLDLLARANQEAVSINEEGIPVPGRTSRLEMLENRLSELLLRYGPAYPEVIRVQSEIQMLEQALAQRDPDDAQTAQNPSSSRRPQGNSIHMVQAQELRAQEERIRRQIAHFEALLSDIPQTQAEYAELVHKRAEQQEVLSRLMGRFGQAEISRQMELQDKATTFRVVDPAVLPTKPHSPNRLKLMIMGMVGGLGLGVGMVVGLDFLDRSVRHVDTLRNLNLPVLAVVPQMLNPTYVRRQQLKNLALYLLAGIGFALIAGAMLMEFMGVAVLYDFVQSFMNRPVVGQFIDSIKQIYWRIF